MNRQMQSKIDETLNGLNGVALKLAERELKNILPLFPTGNEQYMVVGLTFDGVNESLYTRMEDFDGFMNFLGNFYQLAEDDDNLSFEENFSFVAFKNDIQVYKYDSDYQEFDEFEEEDVEDENEGD